jgi:hypothetical protein
VDPVVARVPRTHRNSPEARFRLLPASVLPEETMLVETLLEASEALVVVAVPAASVATHPATWLAEAVSEKPASCWVRVSLAVAVAVAAMAPV